MDVGVSVRVGVKVVVGVSVFVGVDVSVQAAAVAVWIVAVMVACASGEGPHAATRRQILTIRRPGAMGERLGWIGFRG